MTFFLDLLLLLALDATVDVELEEHPGALVADAEYVRRHRPANPYARCHPTTKHPNC